MLFSFRDESVSAQRTSLTDVRMEVGSAASAQSTGEKWSVRSSRRCSEAVTVHESDGRHCFSCVRSERCRRLSSVRKGTCQATCIQALRLTDGIVLLLGLSEVFQAQRVWPPLIMSQNVQEWQQKRFLRTGSGLAWSGARLLNSVIGVGRFSRA